MKKFTTKPRIFRSSPGYVGTSREESKNWVYLGRLAESGPLMDVRFDTDLAHVVALFGKRGSGKSYTMGTLLEGLCTQKNDCTISKNSRNKALLLFDTLGVFQWMNLLLEESNKQEILKEQYALRRGWEIKPEPLDVSVWIPKGTKTSSTPSDHREFSVNCSDFVAEDWGYLLGLDIYQDRMGQLLNDAYIKVTLEGWNGKDRHFQPKAVYEIEDLIACVNSDRELNDAYQSETRRAVLSPVKKPAKMTG